MGRKLRAAVVPVTAALLLLQFAANAWVSEDAHISFRTIDNLLGGHGLRWNVDERVQVYTHPLWLMLIAVAHAVTGEFYTTVTVIALALSTGAYWILARVWRDRPGFVVVALFAPLALSTAVVRYATSGFENSLTFFLYAVFASMVYRSERAAEIPVWKLSLVAALAAVNRLDSILLFLPVLLASLWRGPGSRSLKQLAVGFVPLALWLLFSMFYYGFAFPNTALAKLSSEVPLTLYLSMGLGYWADLVRNDPVSGLLLTLATVVTIVSMVRLRTHRGERVWEQLASLGAGIVLYSAYVVWVGGDFLAGRFWAAPVFASVPLCAAAFRQGAERLPLRNPRIAAALAGGLIVYGVGIYWPAAGVERRVGGRILPMSNARVSLARDLHWQASEAAGVFQLVGEQLRRRAASGERVVEAYPVIGFVGLAAGPDVTIVDTQALADPLLARLPPAETSRIKIGHLERAVPAGYLRARATGSVDAMDPALAEYFGKLRLVVAGPLFDRTRIATLIRFNLGQYDALRARYLERVRSTGTAAESHSP